MIARPLVGVGGAGGKARFQLRYGTIEHKSGSVLCTYLKTCEVVVNSVVVVDLFAVTVVVPLLARSCILFNNDSFFGFLFCGVFGWHCRW